MSQECFTCSDKKRDMSGFAFEDIVVRVGTCIRRARELTNLSEDDICSIDTQIESAFDIIESDFRDNLSNFLDQQGVTEKLRKISLSVVQALNSIDGYNVQPESGSITIIKGNIATTQPLTPLASASSLYFSVTPAHPHFDFILACLSRQEFFELIQLHHYFRNQPARGAYRAGIGLVSSLDENEVWDDEVEEETQWKKEKKKKAS